MNHPGTGVQNKFTFTTAEPSHAQFYRFHDLFQPTPALLLSLQCSVYLVEDHWNCAKGEPRVSFIRPPLRYALLSLFSFAFVPAVSRIRRVLTMAAVRRQPSKNEHRFLNPPAAVSTISTFDGEPSMTGFVDDRSFHNNSSNVISFPSNSTLLHMHIHICAHDSSSLCFIFLVLF